MKRNMLENHPQIEKKKTIAFFTQNETIIFKNQTITIKEQRFISGPLWYDGNVFCDCFFPSVL
jgi:hypothetical protein